MSQVKFTTVLDGKNIEVVGGYDRPLDYYHMTVFNLDSEDDDEVLYCNLSHKAYPKYNDYYKQVLKELGIEPPEGYWSRVSLKEGNVFHSFKNGKWEE